MSDFATITIGAFLGVILGQIVFKLVIDPALDVILKKFFK